MTESKDQMFKLAAGIAGVAAVGAIAYYLLKDEGEATKGHVVAEDNASKVLKILGEIQQSQEKMKKVMKDLTGQLMADGGKSFDSVYQMVEKLQPEDPLEKYGMTMVDFDQLLDGTQYDERVREAISSIMNQPEPSSPNKPVSSDITVKKLVEVHQFMLDELDGIIQEFFAMPESTRSKYDMKTVTISAQAIVGAKMQKKFNMSTDDVEAAVLHLHQELATDREFAQINISMQMKMSQLMTSKQ